MGGTGNATNEPYEEDADGPWEDLGPDERDRDLMDGTWDDRYYRGGHKGRDWKNVQLGLALLVLLGLLVPLFLAVTH